MKSRSFSPMFWRMLWRNATVRRGRSLTAALALAVAAATSTALLDLYIDLDAKLNKEFRKFGANVIVIAAEGGDLAVADIQRQLADGDIVVPLGYAAAKSASGQPVVVAGTDIALLRRINSAWSVTTIAPGGDAMVGIKAAAAIARDPAPVTLSFKGRELALNVSTQVKSGDTEDSQIFIPISAFHDWTGLQPTTFQILVNGSPLQIQAALERLRSALPQAEVRPVRQVSEAQTRVLSKTRGIMLASAILIAFLVALCVLATLTASVLERRKDFAVMKALGSSQWEVNRLFLMEALLLGILGGVAGSVIGMGLAAWIGRVNFQAAVEPRLIVFPIVLGGCVLLSLISAALPLARLHRIQPAVMLKGE
ncbi:MAG: FtsX-like permease family protein [Acidobacteriales bacterium]|nr:FtsX-like permease family protein [Terriglobales bacterium]